MRSIVLLVAWVALVACSSSSASPGSNDVVEAGGDDGSTAGCTSIGGTCESYAAGCPVLQQNPDLCGNVVLVCCLSPASIPPNGELPDAEATSPDASSADLTDDAAIEAGAPRDARAPVDAGGD